MSSNSIKKFFSSFRSKNAGNASISPEPVLSTDNQTELPVDHKTETENDDSLIAVITAAVAMMMSDENGYSAPYPGFRVKRIRRFM